MKFKTALAFLLAASWAPAANITITSALDPAADTGNYHYNRDGVTNRVVFKSPGGQFLTGATPNKYFVGYFVGYNAGMDAQLKDAATAFSWVNDPAKFVPLGAGTAGKGTDLGANARVKNTGIIANTMTDVNYLTGTPNAVANAGVNRGTRIFVLLVAGQTDTTLGAETQYGLFSATDWTIPDSGDANLIYNFKDVDTAAEVFLGSLGSLNLAGVPEPTTSLLALGTVFGLIARRRRA